MDGVSVMLRLPLPPAAPHHALQHAVCARAERARVCAAAEARAGVVSAKGGREGWWSDGLSAPCLTTTTWGGVVVIWCRSPLPPLRCLRFQTSQCQEIPSAAGPENAGDVES